MNKNIKLKSIEKIEKYEQEFIGFITLDDDFVKEQKDLMIKRVQFMKNKFVNECDLEITLFHSITTDKICTIYFQVKYQKYDKYSKKDTGIISFDSSGKIKYSGAFIKGIKKFKNCDKLIKKIKKILEKQKTEI